MLARSTKVALVPAPQETVAYRATTILVFGFQVSAFLLDFLCFLSLGNLHDQILTLANMVLAPDLKT